MVWNSSQITIHSSDSPGSYQTTKISFSKLSWSGLRTEDLSITSLVLSSWRCLRQSYRRHYQNCCLPWSFYVGSQTRNSFLGVQERSAIPPRVKGPKAPNVLLVLDTATLCLSTNRLPWAGHYDSYTRAFFAFWNGFIKAADYSYSSAISNLCTPLISRRTTLPKQKNLHLQISSYSVQGTNFTRSFTNGSQQNFLIMLWLQRFSRH